MSRGKTVVRWSHRSKPGADDDRDVYVIEGRYRRRTMITDLRGADWLEIDAEVRDPAVINAVISAYEKGRVDGHAQRARSAAGR